MKKSFKLIKLLLFVALFSTNAIFATGKINPAVLEKTKKAIVTINTRVAISAYINPGSWTGTGFVTDKENGFIVTNNHVIGPASVGTYFVTFHNGQQVEAKLAYYDLWQDYAVLKIDKSEIPSSVEQIVFSKESAATNQSVLVVSNTEGQDFSFHTGYVSGMYEINGDMPQCSYVINLNLTGGASGSPIMNDKNEAIGVLYGGGKTYVFALKGQYVQKAIDGLKSNKSPTRQHIGVISELYSLDKAVKHRNFPKKEMQEFLKNFPNARNRVVSIQNVLTGSPAEKAIKSGDIIWEIDGKPLGGNLEIFDNGMDNAAKNTVKLTIYRDGKRLEQDVALYDINNNKVKRMINFAGATFFESDDYTSAKSGIPLNALSIANVQVGSSFSVLPTGFFYQDRTLYRLFIRSIGQYNTSNLDDIVKNIPNIIKQKFVTIKFRNHSPYFHAFNSTLISSHDDMQADIVFDSIDTKPRALKYDYKTMEWITEDIILDNEN